MVKPITLHNCAECGADTGNLALICDQCAPDYADAQPSLAGDEYPRPASGTIDLVTFETLRDGPVTETAAQAYVTAVAIGVRALKRGEDRAAPVHDALARFVALSDAGLLKVIS